ncbi:unnamed protein product [Echinostoma caproni]|uniref:acetyl-CoA C-acetyltransferase n=1 Tax=Echinostoma caproni TaxID=27848 RepID=A0A183AS55_9TREM|nr:unnamed protein product [Echinostoma caproni]
MVQLLALRHQSKGYFQCGCMTKLGKNDGSFSSIKPPFMLRLGKNREIHFKISKSNNLPPSRSLCFHIQGRCAEKTAADMKITREDQDEYAKMSYERSQAAAKQGVFAKEITPVRVPDKRAPNGFVEVTEDEEYKRVDFARFPKLKPAFLDVADGGTITAANASGINDAAAATILCSASFAAKDRSLTPLARIVAYADAARDTIDFAIAPHLAVEKLLRLSGISKDKVAMWEINEAFAVVALANIRLLELPIEKVNIHGGAVSCGHPLGMSGARITNHLALNLKPGQYGVAAICNGGGGASAIMLEGL